MRKRTNGCRVELVWARTGLIASMPSRGIATDLMEQYKLCSALL